MINSTKYEVLVNKIIDLIPEDKSRDEVVRNLNSLINHQRINSKAIEDPRLADLSRNANFAFQVIEEEDREWTKQVITLIAEAEAESMNPLADLKLDFSSLIPLVKPMIKEAILEAAAELQLKAQIIDSDELETEDETEPEIPKKSSKKTTKKNSKRTSR